jgi:hypothetical protein
MLMTNQLQLFCSLMIGALIFNAPPARSEPMAVQCQIADIPIAFDSIDILKRTPQPGTGRVVVQCNNLSNARLKLTLTAIPDGNGERNGEWVLRQPGSSAIGLKIFSDPQHQQPLGTIADPNRALIHQQLIDGQSQITVSMPFFTQLTLSGLPAGGAHRSPADFRLTYCSE